MKKTLVITALAFALVAIAPAALGNASGSLAVSASVSANCTIAAGSLLFGAYDPVVVNAAGGVDRDATGTMLVTCTKGFAPTIITTTAGGAMTSTPAGFSLNYFLYSDPGRTTDFTGGFLMPASSSNKTPLTLTIYGRIPKDQDVGVAAYNDTFTVTVNF